VTHLLQHRLAQDGDRSLAGGPPDVDDVHAALRVVEFVHQVAGALQPPLELGFTLLRVVERLGWPGDQGFDTFEGGAEFVVQMPKSSSSTSRRYRPRIVTHSPLTERPKNPTYANHIPRKNRSGMAA